MFLFSSSSFLICLQIMTAINAKMAAPPIPTTTPMTMFLEWSLRPEEEKSFCRPGTNVVGTSVEEVKVSSMVVETPFTTVTTSVVYVE